MDPDTERQPYFSKVKVIAQLSHNLCTLKLALFFNYWRNAIFSGSGELLKGCNTFEASLFHLGGKMQWKQCNPRIIFCVTSTSVLIPNSVMDMSKFLHISLASSHSIWMFKSAWKSLWCLWSRRSILVYVLFWGGKERCELPKGMQISVPEPGNRYMFSVYQPNAWKGSFFVFQSCLLMHYINR